MSIYKKLLDIQSELKAPKNQRNTFGNYNYRSCEDILEGVKPLLKEHNTTLMIHDQIVNIGNRYYICATVTFIDVESGEKIMCEGLAREEESKKGMDGSQVTGAASSYARKYALNGLFCIDDTKDSDATNTGDKTNKQNTTSSKQTESKKESKKDDPDNNLRKTLINMCLELSGNNKDVIPDMIEGYSFFENKEGKEIAGKRTTKELSGGRLKVTYGKAKKEYIEQFGEEQFNKKYKEDGVA